MHIKKLVEEEKVIGEISLDEELLFNFYASGLSNYIKQKEKQVEWEELCSREDEYWTKNQEKFGLGRAEKIPSFFMPQLSNVELLVLSSLFRMQ